jgi:hypothetical protein
VKEIKEVFEIFFVARVGHLKFWGKIFKYLKKTDSLKLKI